MSLLDKLKFWKKEEPYPMEKGADLGLDREFGTAIDPTAGLGGTGALGTFPEDTMDPGMGMSSGRGFEAGTGGGAGSGGMRQTSLEDRNEGYARPRPMQMTTAQDMVSKDIEIVSAKLDSIRSTLEALNMRMATMEQELQRLVRKGGW